jgi:2-polyprenyl-3-methyl-5-hydroxy-6-metoxy-1,4-benzoquinol methylase
LHFCKNKQTSLAEQKAYCVYRPTESNSDFLNDSGDLKVSSGYLSFLQKCKLRFQTNLQKCKKEMVMESDRIKWNQRFESEATYLGQRPSPFLSREIQRIVRLAPGKRALDIACGEGRNSIFLAQQGFYVAGLDISDVGLGKAALWAEKEGLQIDFQRVDLDDYRFSEQFDLIINFNFLLRELVPEAMHALSPGGLLIIDTIMESPQLCASHNRSYLLKRGELLRLCEELPGEILFSEELAKDEMPTARVLFRKSD